MLNQKKHFPENAKNSLKQILLLFGFILTNTFTNAQEFDWAKSMGASNSDYGETITTDAAGNVYSAGQFRFTVDFDPGPEVFNLSAPGFTNYGFITKFDPEGNFLWAIPIGGPEFSNVRINSAAVDPSGNIVVIGEFKGTIDFDPSIAVHNLTSTALFGTSDSFVAKYNTDGTLIWAKQIAGENSKSVNELAIDEFGNIHLVGEFRATVDFDPDLVGTYNLTATSGFSDIFVTKLSSEGNFVWTKQFTGYNYKNGNSIALDPAGNVLTTGDFSGVVDDFDPGPDVFPVVESGDGSAVFINKLDADGNFVWTTTIDEAEAIVSKSIVVDNLGEIYIGCDKSSGDFETRMYIRKLNVDGLLVWIKEFADASGSSRISAMDFDGNEMLLVLGTFSGEGAFAGPILNATDGVCLIHKFDISGDFIWAKQYGGNNATATDIKIDPCKSILTTGSFWLTQDFDIGPEIYNLTSAGLSDVYIQKTTQTSMGSITVTACDSYLSPSADYTWTETGVYVDTITSDEGCDSLVSINLTILNSTATSISPISCDHYISPSTNYTWMESGTYSDTLTNALGCDSVITVNLTINNSSTTAISPVVCDTYTSPSGIYTWTESGIYSDTLTNALGCDSVITIDLTIIPVDVNVINLAPLLVAAASDDDVEYQWLDCDNDYAIIEGETNQSFDATANGNYAVEITRGSCVDTSTCQTIANIGINEMNIDADIVLFPNPTNNIINIQTSFMIDLVEVFTLSGQRIIVQKENQVDLAAFEDGTYLFKITTPEGVSLQKVIKN